MMNTDQRFLTVEQLAEWLQVPKSWVYDRTYRDEIPHYKLGNHLRFDVIVIEKWLKERARGFSKIG